MLGEDLNLGNVRAQGSRGLNVEISVTFAGMLPDEDVVALVKRFAQTRLHASVAARIEQLPLGRFRVEAHAGLHMQSFEHADPYIAVCGAFERLELDLLAEWPYAERDAAE